MRDGASLSKDPDGSVIYYPRSSIRSTKCSAVTMFIVDKLELPRARDAAARARAPTALESNIGSARDLSGSRRSPQPHATMYRAAASAGRFIGRGAGATRAARPMAPARRHGGGGTVYEIGGKEFSTEQVVGGVFTFYCVLAFVGTRGGKKEEKVEAATGGASTGGVMSMMDDGFDAWASVPANMKKWEESIAAMK